MGLDMYLNKKTYIWSDWNNGGKKELSGITLPEKYSEIKPERISNITEEVAYWRKANQIHNWFVKNVQSGVDDCGEYYVSKEKLQELYDLCNQIKSTVKYEKGDILIESGWKEGKEYKNYKEGNVISNVEEIKQLLPTTGGFFFGSTTYDEYYMQDIEQTIEMLEPLLKENGDFYYSSSW